MTLRFLSFGAGAIGTYIGGSLAIQGHRVVFLERPEVAAELRQRGLRLNLNGQEHTIPHPSVAATLEEALQLCPFDAAIFALKSFDTRPALENLAPYAAALPPVLCLQNGVENEGRLAEVLGSEKVIAATVTSAVGRRAAGDIVLERLRGVGIANVHCLAPTLVDTLEAAGLNARLYADAGSLKWSKMLTNLIGNATSAILDMPPADVFAHRGLYGLEMAQLRETILVMAAQKIGVVDLPGTPVRLLALGVQALPNWLSRPLLQRAAGSGRGAKMPSFHIDLHSGRGKSEVDYLNGAVVRAGKHLGIPTPANRLLNDTLLALTDGKLPLDAYAWQPEKLLGSYQVSQSSSLTTP